MKYLDFKMTQKLASDKVSNQAVGLLLLAAGVCWDKMDISNRPLKGRSLRCCQDRIKLGAFLHMDVIIGHLTSILDQLLVDFERSYGRLIFYYFLDGKNYPDQKCTIC